MNLFELFVKIDANTDGVEKGIKQAQKTTEQYRKDVMNLAQTYKKQGMDMSSAMKRAYSEIDKSQYQTANNSKSDSKKFALNWENAGNKISGIASKIGNGLKVAAKIGTVAVGAASTAIVGLMTTATKSYAEFEQLVGGAELMFGEAFDTVKKNAEEAYKTVQMSQNEYLQQVNGFATGLKTALGGNEQAAADLAHKIIKAEADIVAATGNTAENVQNAFNGIMKSNFTMLDNLQIGITPTKEGFQEVIDKVNEWNKANGEATNYQMGNLADMQSALVDYIDMVGMSGYAQAEASKTITGSLASMKSAWSNLLTGIADDNADFDTLINNMVESVGTFAVNILPRVEVALNGFVGLIEGVVPKIVEKLPELASSVLPKLVSGATALLTSVASMLPGIVDVALNTVLPELLSGIGTIAKVLLQSLPTIFSSLASGIESALPMLIETAISLVDEIAKVLPDLIDAIIVVLPSLFKTLADALLKEGLPQLVEIVMTLATELVKLVPDLVSALTEILPAFYEAFIPAVLESLPILIEGLIPLITELFAALPAILVSAFLLGNPLSLLFAAIYATIKTYGEDIKNFFAETIPQFIADIIAWFEELPYKIGVLIGEVILFFQGMPEKIKTWLLATIEKIKTWISDTKNIVQQKVPEIIDKIKNIFSDLPAKIKTIGKNIVDGLWNGISSGWTWLKNKVNNLVKSLVNGVKSTLGIKSPSRVFRDQIGKQMAAGLGIGWEQEFSDVKGDIEDSLNFGETDYGITTSSTSISDFANGARAYSSSSQNVNVTVGIDDSANAMGLARALLPFLKIAEKEVYA